MNVWPIVMPARLESGTLKLNRRRLQALLAGHRDCNVQLTIERRHATRSLNQNAYYWSAVVETLSEHTGFTPDEMHEVLKAKFLPKKLAVTDGNGEIKGEFVIGGTTTRLNKVQFGDYLRDIQVWASTDLGVYIPAPNEFNPTPEAVR